jgi:NitT/TauT family transport system substrate-binding protein
MGFVRKASLLGLAVMICASAACSSPDLSSAPVIRVGHAPHDHHSPLYVAAFAPDHFRKNGGLYLREVVARSEYDLMDGGSIAARVLVDSSTGGKEIIRRLAENHLDVTFGGVPAMLSAIDRGRDIRIIAPVMAEGAGLVVPAGSPLGSFDDFVDHVRERPSPFRVGYKAGGSVQNLIFERALAEKGITFSKDLEDEKSQVILVNVHGPKNLIPSMEGSVIDGFVVMQPYLALAESRGAGKTIAYVDAESAAVESFLVLMMRANRYIVRYPDRSARAVAAWLDLPLEVEEASLPTIRFIVDLDSDWNRGVDFWIETMIETGFVKGHVKEAFSAGKHRQLLYDEELFRRARNRI